ncbi:uncharacterized protein PAC_04411 [Phialocephala subalpina]|uniref:Uncharacterized protein n=1 Tax=Phialocephala subalpina TaxID=576137 RepID=A0A1L7WP38_9HELO|nr:uncharacterized protein PAC_04411 [Phialocephala subalpina]
METAQSFTARRSAASNLPAFQLPPPDHLSQHKYQPAYALNTSQPTPAIVSSVLTPPPSLQSGLSPWGAASVNSQSSGSSAGGPPYQPMGYWPTPGNNGSYTYSQPPPMPPTFAQGQLNYNNMGRPLYSPSMNYSNRNTNSPASGEGLPLPPDDITLPLFPTSMSSRQAQSLPQFTPQQKMAQQQQQALSQAPPQGPLHAPNNYGELPPPTPTNYYGQGSPPAMAGPIMSNFHSPGNQMALVGGKNMPIHYTEWARQYMTITCSNISKTTDHSNATNATDLSIETTT